MISTKPLLVNLLKKIGSDVTFHREEGGVPCPCRTPEGFRDPAWHIANPTAPMCNEQGFLNVVIQDFIVKASIQPALRGAGLSRINQVANTLLGDVQVDDKLGVFPCEWEGHTLSFDGWSEAGEDYILYDGHRYTVVAHDKLPDINGDPDHHFEVGMRLLRARVLA